MNEDPVLIVDDDVDMEPVVILDEDDENTQNEKTFDVPIVPAVETIDLDDETPIITEVETQVNNIVELTKPSEISFRNNLENNRLMDKIVTTCINMENAMGMPRVVYKTLLPLYRDTNNRFKESDAFRALLKRTHKLLLRDPDHKFLHIKTLCEELKSGGLRRKVPFVTLATNLKNNGLQQESEELTSSSREINHNNVEDREVKVNKNTRTKKKYGPAPKRKFKRGKGKRGKKKTTPAKDKIKTRSITNAEKETTFIIDLDDSETDTVGDNEDSENNCDSQNDVIVIEETEPSNERNDNTNTVLQETEEDSNKENNDKNGQISENEMDYELLIPTNICNVVIEEQPVPHIPDENDINLEIACLEKQIAFDKQMIDQLEEQEVLTENPQMSPYCLCSKYKENIVRNYKRICELKGDRDDLVKRREIRLRVAEGHPSGPAQRLETFLNDTIDETGTVQFPDFAEVVTCVVDANLGDNLGWSGKQVIQEAVALFRQCGQALRKRRQKREYKDLLSLIRDKEETDDPAEKDPVLLAKLEENKLIAKIKEEEILNRYVSMECNASFNSLGNPHERVEPPATAEFDSDKDSSDSESEENIATPNTEKRTNAQMNTTVSETVVSSNNAMMNSSSDRNSITTTIIRNKESEINSEPNNVTDVQNNVSSTTDGIEQNCDSSSISTEIKTEDIVKKEPLDIQSMLDQLEDGFVCEVFDIEDPFLVIEISSDGFTDDEDL
ncbi:hypothetical protein PYW07_004984 [Mythimna separata]|uniref:Daxx histone-binding domain-containing protein n=1 Tax=Mythimna separata TaxID=271217 RepID=A0AAD7YED5_MYTSE|nr:hypothetical protein PYW07_004984 [Mythimna separata]